MTVCKALIAALLAIAANSELQAQTISGPLLGFVPDSTGEALSPVLGVPGASMLGDALPLAANIDALAVSARQNFALGVRRDDGAGQIAGQIVRIDLTQADLPTTDVAGGSQVGSSLIAISPSGTAAAAYDRGTGRAQIMSGPSDSARIDIQWEATGLSEVSSIAVSDDASVILLNTAEGLWAVDRNSGVWRIPVDGARAAVFLPTRRDAIIADDATKSAILLSDIGPNTTLEVLSFADDNEPFRAVSTSEDGRTVVLAGAAGSIQIVDFWTRYVTRVSCQCSPTLVERMNGPAAFRLTAPSADGPMAMLDASTSTPRVVLILPRVTD
jgi:hypothetical protein